jgi:hypothetical protein
MVMVCFNFEQLPQNLRHEVERYLETHSCGPAARLRPTFGVAQNVWVAFIQANQQEKGNIGAGKTPAAALERFDEAFCQISAEQAEKEWVCDSLPVEMQVGSA